MDIKYLPDGSAVVVIGDAPPHVTSGDGGRTSEEVGQVYVARLDMEAVDSNAVLDERPTYDEDTATWVQAGQDEPVAQPASTPSGATDAKVIHARGDAMTADQLDAEIARLQAQKAEAQTAANSTDAEPPAIATQPGPTGV